jgi:hypothetical protein
MKGAPLPTDTFTVGLVHAAARQVDLLAERLAAAGPEETRQILNAVVDAEDGVLGRTVTLLATSAYRARQHNDPQAALYGQAANDLYDLLLRLDAEWNPVPAPAAAQPALTTAPAPGRRTR